MQSNSIIYKFNLAILLLPFKKMKNILLKLFMNVTPPFIRDFYRNLKLKYVYKYSMSIHGLEDKFINIIGHKKNGFYIELGANNGINQSNTFKLQKILHWDGILIEPNPTLAHECVINRSFARSPQVSCAACVPFGYEEHFVEIVDFGLMSVAKNLDIDSQAIKAFHHNAINYKNNRKTFVYGAVAKTLNEILLTHNAPANIDFLSLDVEGNEESVLRGIDFDHFSFNFILVEIYKNNKKVASYLESQGYSFSKILSENPQYSDILFSKSPL